MNAFADLFFAKTDEEELSFILSSSAFYSPLFDPEALVFPLLFLPLQPLFFALEEEILSPFRLLRK